MQRQKSGSLLLVAGVLLLTMVATASGATGEERFEVGFWIDHQDFATPGGGRAWDTISPKGLEEIITYCQESGANAIYFRGFGGGLAIHNSQLEEGLYPQRIDKRRTSDPLPDNGAVRYGACQPDIIATVVSICHRKGMKCLLYWPWEDTHNLQCFLSRFALEHPGLWDERADGYSSPARLSLAFREVRQYKLGLARELLALGVDGLFLDYRRQSNWTPEFGYVRPARAAFEKQFGAAPEANSESWLRFRAAYNTWMLEELRGLGKETGRPIEIIAAPPQLTPDPMEQLRTRFVDWPSWVALGLVDGLAPDGLMFDPQRPMESIVDNMNQVRGMIAGRAKLYWSIRSAYDWGNGLRTLSSATKQPLEATLDAVLQAAWENGAAGVQIDTYDPGSEPQPWIDTLRRRTENEYRLVNPRPRAPAEAAPVQANYTRPADVEPAPIPKPAALEDRVAPQRLTHSDADDTEARFSPDGKWIVFQSDRGGEGEHLWIVAADGGEPRPLTNGKCHDLFPTFSPDGQTIVFSSDRADGRYYHLYRIPTAGGEPAAVTSGPATDTLPCFSPDGQEIVFTSTRGTDLYHHSNVLYTVPAAGGEPKSWGLLTYAQVQPTIASDGRWVAFTAWDDLQNVNSYIALSRYGDPANRVRLTPPNESCYGGTISPDGAAVAYTSPGPDRSRGWDLWIRAVHSDTLHRITNGTANDRSPSWSPDGQRLVFESNRDGKYNLCTIAVADLALPHATCDEPWSQLPRPAVGWADGDLDPEHTPLAMGPQARPALDYNNRSFGRHLGSKQPVKAITLVDDMPNGPCRIDQTHVELYYGDRNGDFRRYTGPMTFAQSTDAGTTRITLGGLDLTTTIVKVRLAYADKDYTAVCSTLDKALLVDPPADTEQQGVRVWTTLDGTTRLLPWHASLGGWEGRGHELLAVDTPESDLHSGEGARIVLPYRVGGDFQFACQFFLPDNSNGAGGPIVFFRAQDDRSFYTFRFINGWGTAVLHKKSPGQPWIQIGYSTGHELAVGQWHDLTVRGRGADFAVLADGQKLVEGHDAEFRDGAIGLGCQVRQVHFRNVRVEAERLEPLAAWPTASEPKPYSVVCSDAGRGGYQAFPGLCRLNNGDLLAVFYAGWTHVSRPGDPRFPNGGAVALCRSTDDGKTWGPAQIILDTPLDDRDPAVWECDDGTIYVSCVSVDWPNFKVPYDNWCYNHRVRSTDHGHTWSEPAELRIGQQHDYTTWTEPRRLRDGQWLWPVYRNHNTEFTTAMLRSTDGGHSWGPPQLLDANSRSTDEPDLCQLADGTLFCAMRPGSEPYMWQSRSDDQGRTWSPAAPLPFFGHCANLLQTRSEMTLLGHRDPGMTIHWSRDQAQTWAGAAMIDPCGGAYSQMVELPDQRILVVYYTEGSHSEIRAQFLRADESGIRGW